MGQLSDITHVSGITAHFGIRHFHFHYISVGGSKLMFSLSLSLRFDYPYSDNRLMFYLPASAICLSRHYNSE